MDHGVYWQWSVASSMSMLLLLLLLSRLSINIPRDDDNVQSSIISQLGIRPLQKPACNNFMLVVRR